MRSYEAARSLFSILSFGAWVLIAVGGIAAFLGGAQGSEMARWGGASAGLAFIMGMLPGIALMIAGFFGLVFAQIGRAGVDSAEYGQQMLQISRDQLEVSRQSLRQGEVVKTGFEALQAAKVTEPSASFASLRDRAAPASSDTMAPTEPQTIEYRGREITALAHGFLFDGTEFSSLNAAKARIDDLAAGPYRQLSSAS